MKLAIEQVFDGSIESVVTPYDSTKLVLGSHYIQNTTDSYVGPNPPAIMYTGESGLAIPAAFTHPLKINSDLWWIFGSDLATAAATRRVQLWTWIPSTNTVSLVGGITQTFPTATNHTVRGIRAILTNITTGTVSVSGTAVTGSGTEFTTGISVGSRIGFGSTNPDNITTWYEVSATGSATGLTLTADAGTISAGTAYVIQDLVFICTTTNATTTNGGLFVTKGLRYEIFQQPATVIPAATTVDKIRAVYWLKDAATVTNTVAGGCALEDTTSLTDQFTYVSNGSSTSLIIFKYNFRAPLTVASGAATLSGADLVKTGTQVVTGNLTQNNNGRVATLGHGPGSGVSCIYFVTSTRILRVVATDVIAASTTFVSDSMAEVPPGGASTNLTTAAFTAFDYASSIDRLVISGATQSGTFYVTQYQTDGSQFERRFGLVSPQLNSSGADIDQPRYPHAVQTSNVIYQPWVEDGWMFISAQSTTATINNVLIYPLAADWLYADTTGERIICPEMSLGASKKLYRVAVNATENIGSQTLGVTPDAYRLKYRTSGITDGYGSWTSVPDDGDLSSVGAVSSIQFAIECRTLGVVLLPARIKSLALIYESSDELPSQYRWNFGDFDAGTATFAWVQSALFGGSIGVHTIEVYRADTDALVLTQASSGSTNGTFENWDGAAWVSGLGADTVGRRRRFVPSGSLPGGVDLYAKIQVA